jgi:HAD superfamily hydrolase (TIGR01509 family)
MLRSQQVVFFDVGNVLIDDDPFLAEIFRRIHQAIPSDSPKFQVNRFLGDVERALRVHGHQAVDRIGYRFHGRGWLKLRKKIHDEVEQQWWHLVHAIPGSLPVLDQLHKRYRLGLIANQPPQVMDCLGDLGLLPLFDVVLLDSDYHVAKPDPTLYRLAMEQARIDPEDGAMVGDRLDNDIIPARRLGMRAILMWLAVDKKGWQPGDAWGERFYEILERLPTPRWDRIPPKEHPTSLVRSWDALPIAVEEVWAAPL